MAIDPGRVGVVIPALNEEESLPGVLRELKAQGLSHILVVDNGSTDRTAAVARKAGAVVVEEPRRGYGQACWTGVQALPGHLEWILFCDADGCDDLGALPKFFESAESADLVLANRRATPESRGALTPVQNFGNALATFLIRLGWGGRFSDLGPCRLIRRDVFESLEMEDRGFGWTVEMQARAAERGVSSVEIPVDYRNRTGGRSKISGTLRGSAQAGVIILTTLGALWLRKPKVQTALVFLSALLLLAGSALMMPHGDFKVAGTVPSFLVGAGVASGGFALSWGIRSISFFWFWAVLLGARLLLFPMVPGDDIWRYLWEGLIQNHGYCPYMVAPADAVLEPLRTDYWHLINHREMTAIYPPVTQILFRGFSVVSDTVSFYKAVFLLADIGVCLLLARRFGRVAALLYAWNPLVIYNLAGGAHFDGLFILFLTAAWLVFSASSEPRPWRFRLSALLLGMSIGIKWVSAPFLAFLCLQAWRRRQWSLGIQCGLLALLPVALSFIIMRCPVSPAELAPRDFALYARSAELIPRVVGLFWEESRRMNWIFVPPLAVATLVLVWRCRRLVSMGEGFFFTLLVLSPAVHAWYFLWLVPFAVATRNWGTRWVSISGFTYFILQERTALNTDPDVNPWVLTPMESFFLWGPFVAGFCWTRWKEARS